MGLGLVGCTSFTAVDWTLIPPPEAAPGGSASGGSDAAAGNNDAGGQPAGGQGGVASGAGGEGEGGYAGEVGGAPPDTAGTGTGGGGMGGGMGGVAGVGGGGAASLGGMSGGGNAGTAGSGGGTAGTGGGATTLCSVYPTGPLATDFTGKIVLFDGGTKPAGDKVSWGGRVGIDNACKQAALALGLTKKIVHALAAADVNQAINSNVVGNYAEAFEVPTTTMIVSKFGLPMGMWPEFAQFPRKSLICAGVFPADVTEWFSGVTASGEPDVLNNCSAWTFGEPSVETRAFAGRTDTTARVFHEHWLSDHWVSCDNTTAHALCLAWGD